MKKLILFLLFFFPFALNAQQHSDLWLKVQQIRNEKYPETANRSFDEREIIKGVGYMLTPCLIFDRKPINGNAILESHQLSEIAGIVYLPIDTPENECTKCATIFGSWCSLGVILIYTKTYALANPEVIPTFDYVFP